VGPIAVVDFLPSAKRSVDLGPVGGQLDDLVELLPVHTCALSTCPFSLGERGGRTKSSMPRQIRRARSRVRMGYDDQQ